MANYTIAANARAIHGIDLAAGTEDQVAFTARIDGDVTVLVHPGSSSPVYVTADGAAAIVGGANTRVVWPGYAVRLTDQRQGTLSGLEGSTDSSPTVIRLISAGTPTYSVEA